MKVISAADAAHLIKDGDTVVTGGFGCCGHADALTAAIEQRFKASGTPRGLTLLFAAGPGDKATRGLNALAHRGLLTKAVGGFWGFAPRLAELVRRNEIEAHNWPQGVLSQLFRSIASGAPGVLTQVGLGTFVDPRFGGGLLNTVTSKPLVRLVTFEGEEYLLYPRQPVHVALIRGTRMDTAGNLSMEHEISLQDTLAQAQAAKNSGGIVIAQARRLVEKDEIQPHDVRVPGFLIDYGVISSSDEEHPQTYAEVYNPEYVTAGNADEASTFGRSSLVRTIIARRAARELLRHPGAVVNLGIGIPAEIGQAAAGLQYDDYKLTVESGGVGGVPAYGLSFGASRHPDAIIEQAAMFDFYSGGGLTLAFLGFAQVDGAGNVNASKFDGLLPGVGGFVNISTSARNLVFCGTFTARGLVVGVEGSKLQILREGEIPKFCERVDQLSFNGPLSRGRGQNVQLITERAVMKLTARGLEVTEIAPGVDVSRDILRRSRAPLSVSRNLVEMDRGIFDDVLRGRTNG